MDFEEYLEMQEAMKAIKARMQLDRIQAQTYRHLKEEKDKSKLHRELSRLAYPDNFKRKIVRLDEVQF
jgi:hypothetical protein